MDGVLKADKISLETLGKFAAFFKCPINELYAMHFYEDGKEIVF
jgi:hypothetical protein